ncbi:MAG TPA: phage protein [Acidimicrobiales bacterium]|nr:phage protein [Acidimicrobiales bacterium]
MAVETYAPEELVITFGPVLMSGFADADVTIEHNEDSFTFKAGLDGKGTRTKNANKSGRVTVPLMQTSLANDLLSAIAQVDRKTGQGVFPLLAKDLSGRTVYAAQDAWIVKPPASGFGKEAGQRDWIFETDNLEFHVGGN